MYGELQQQGLLDKYKQALNLFLANQNQNTNNSNPFDGYFGGGSNANAATPYYGDIPYPWVTLDVTNPQLYKELHNINIMSSPVGLEDLYRSRYVDSKPLIKGRVNNMVRFQRRKTTVDKALHKEEVTRSKGELNG